MPRTNNQNDPTDPQQAVVQGINQPAQPQAAAAAPAGMRPAGWEDDDVAAQVAEITSKGTPVMRQARSAGMRQANTRGVLNSTMAIQAAEDSAYRVAVPIASQNAAQRATRNQIRLDAGYQGERQERDIAAQLERMRTQAGFDTTARSENFGYQSRLNEAGYAAEMERLGRQLEHATATQQVEIRARMDELTTNIAGQQSLSAQNFGQQRVLNSEGYAAERQNLQLQLANANEQQRTEIQARLTMLDREWENRGALSEQEFGQTQQLQQGGYAAERQNLQMQLANANEQQRTEIEARLTMLDTEWAARGGLSEQEFGQNSQLQQGGYAAERDRMVLSNQFNVAMAGIQQGNARELTQLQGGIQSALQAQGSSELVQRMTHEFSQNLALNTQQNEAALRQISASGDQRMREMAGQVAASLNELTLSLNQRNSEAAANAAVQLFNAEAQIRAALLSNPEMPAAERSSYERAIASLTTPTRNYINSVLGSGSGSGTGTGGGAGTGTGMAPIPTAPTPTAPTGTGGMAPTGGFMSNMGAGGYADVMYRAALGQQR